MFHLSLLFILPKYTLSQIHTDSTYIGIYPQKYYGSAFLLSSMLLLHYDGVQYLPNVPLNTGIGFAIKNSIVNVQYSYGAIPLGKADKGKTSSLDMQVHHYGRKWIFDLYLQRYKGFYTTSKTDNSISLYPDLKFKQIVGEFQYFKNGDHFSTRAAFEQSEQQLQSAGSFVIGGNIYYYNLDVGNQFPLEEEKKSNNIQLGGSAGYAYSWVFRPGWLWTSIVHVGINTGNKSEALKDWKLKIYPNVSAKTAIGYHGSDWGAYFSMLLNNKAIYLNQSQKMQILTLNMQMTYVKHFGK